MTRIARMLAPVTILFLARAAAAQEVEAHAEFERAPSRPFEHEGLYLRGALGLGAAGYRDLPESGEHTPTASATGGGWSGEISVGGTPWPGLVVAATLLGQSVMTGRYDNGSNGMHSMPGATFAMLGGTLDLFPSPRDGFHFGGTVGPAGMSSMHDDGGRRWSAGLGGGASFFVGEDWWIARQWSLGILVRATFARMLADETTLSPSVSGQRSLAALSVSFTALYH